MFLSLLARCTLDIGCAAVTVVVGGGFGSTGLFLYRGPFSEVERLRFSGTAVCSVIPSRVSLFCTSVMSMY